MDARERAEKIAEAALDGWRDPGGKFGWMPGMRRAGLAAVSRAYELDGVRELVEAAERALREMEGCGLDGCEKDECYTKATLMAAAARVREAMGNTTPRPGGETGEA